MEWQPISTIPNDGTFVLVYNNDREFHVVNNPSGCDLGRWFKINGHWFGFSEFIHPTHWMKLPDPPKEA
jgi:hypothetical protein